MASTEHDLDTLTRSNASSDNSKWPYVSVVIPVFNNADRLRKVLKAVQKQDYPANRYEVIVVDNGSTDRSPDVARSMEGVRLLFETEHLNSPYSARNRGIEDSSGEIVVVVDSTCRPVSHWLRSGVQTLKSKGGDLLGGRVKFEYGDRVTAGKIFDALTNLKMKEYVENRQVATTTNLFVRREVFEKQGLFPEGIRSGGDIRWTGSAVRAGWKLVFGENTVGFYPARSLTSLLRKQFRVAKGQPTIWQEEGRSDVVLRIIKDFLAPVPLQLVKDKIERRGEEFMYNYIYQVWVVHYIVKWVMTVGRVYGLVRSSANGG